MNPPLPPHTDGPNRRTILAQPAGTNPEERRMKDIDWSKAPEGATHWYPPFFYKVDGRRAAHSCGSGWSESRYQQLPATAIPRPTTPQWNGTGLPPIGVVCEVMSTTASGEWLEAMIVAHDGAAAVYRLYDGSYGGDLEFFEDNPARPLFRPFHTPEQIAAEEREVAIHAMLELFETNACKQVYDMRGGVAAIYDAGYRMTAEDER